MNLFSTDNIEDALSAQSNLSIDCESLDDCPEHVGGMARVEKNLVSSTYNSTTYQYKLNACSVTLISPDTILTNKHCVKQRTIGETCGSTTIFFPNTKGSEICM